jgi:hypothetical protein
VTLDEVDRRLRLTLAWVVGRSRGERIGSHPTADAVRIEVVVAPPRPRLTSFNFQPRAPASEAN